MKKLLKQLQQCINVYKSFKIENRKLIYKKYFLLYEIVIRQEGIEVNDFSNLLHALTMIYLYTYCRYNSIPSESNTWKKNSLSPMEKLQDKTNQDDSWDFSLFLFSFFWG